MRTLPLAISVVLALPSVALADKATERRLYPDQVEASSFLWNDWNKFQENYHPNYVGDDDPKTAWTEGADGSGAGEWIRLHLTKLDGTSKLRLHVRAGYQKTHRLFLANARPKQVTVKLLPGGGAQQLTLADQEGWQDLAIEQPAGPVDAVELKIDSVYEGSKYTDLCISDVQVFATSTTKENPAFEKSKRKTLLAWKAQRVAAAKLFKKAAGQALPLLPAYRLESTDGNPGPGDAELEACDWKAPCMTKVVLALAGKDKDFAARFGGALKLAAGAVDGKQTGFVTGQLAPSDKRPVPAVDGLYVPDFYTGQEEGYGNQGLELPILGIVGALTADGLRPLEVKDAVAFDTVLDHSAKGCAGKKGRTASLLLRQKVGEAAAARDVLRVVAIARCGEIEVRDGTDTVSDLQLLVYGEDGKLVLTAGPGYVDGFEWSDVGVANADNAGHPAIVGGLAITSEGRHNTLVRGEVAKAP